MALKDLALGFSRMIELNFGWKTRIKWFVLKITNIDLISGLVN